MQSESRSCSSSEHIARPEALSSPGRTVLALGLLLMGALLSLATSSRPPVIEQVRPGMGDSAVDASAPVEITFEEPVDPDTVDTESVRLVRRADGQAVPATLEVTEGDRVVRLVPADPLRPETDYEVRLDLGRLASRDGEAYAGLRLDPQSSEVLETSGVLAVPFTTRSVLQVARAFRSEDPDELRVYFSDSVDPAGLTLEAVRLRCDGQPVDVDLRYSEEDNRLRVLPLSPLSAARSCDLSLDGSIRSASGNLLGGGRGDVISFQAGDDRLR